MAEVIELSEVTKELLRRVDELKKNIKESMTYGESKILKGIVIFETVLSELNPSVIDDEQIIVIESCVRRCLSKKEELTQHIDAYVHYGVNRCFLMLESFNNVNKAKISRKK